MGFSPSGVRIPLSACRPWHPFRPEKHSGLSERSDNGCLGQVRTFSDPRARIRCRARRSRESQLEQTPPGSRHGDRQLAWVAAADGTMGSSTTRSRRHEHRRPARWSPAQAVGPCRGKDDRHVTKLCQDALDCRERQVDIDTLLNGRGVKVVAKGAVVGSLPEATHSSKPPIGAGSPLRTPCRASVTGGHDVFRPGPAEPRTDRPSRATPSDARSTAKTTGSQPQPATAGTPSSVDRCPRTGRLGRSAPSPSRPTSITPTPMRSGSSIHTSSSTTASPQSDASDEHGTCEGIVETNTSHCVDTYVFTFAGPTPFRFNCDAGASPEDPQFGPDASRTLDCEGTLKVSPFPPLGLTSGGVHPAGVRAQWGLGLPQCRQRPAALRPQACGRRGEGGAGVHRNPQDRAHGRSGQLQAAAQPGRGALPARTVKLTVPVPSPLARQCARNHRLRATAICQVQRHLN